MKTVQWNVVLISVLLSACMGTGDEAADGSSTQVMAAGNPLAGAIRALVMVEATVAEIQTCSTPPSFGRLQPNEASTQPQHKFRE